MKISTLAFLIIATQQLVQAAATHRRVSNKIDQEYKMASEAAKWENGPEVEPLRRVKRANCAIILRGKCIPSCVRYHGKTPRRCNSTEKKKHLLFYILR